LQLAVALLPVQAAEVQRHRPVGDQGGERLGHQARHAVAANALHHAEERAPGRQPHLQLGQVGEPGPGEKRRQPPGAGELPVESPKAASLAVSALLWVIRCAASSTLPAEVSVALVRSQAAWYPATNGRRGASDVAAAWS